MIRLPQVSANIDHMILLYVITWCLHSAVVLLDRPVVCSVSFSNSTLLIGLQEGSGVCGKFWKGCTPKIEMSSFTRVCPLRVVFKMNYQFLS